jgi:(1->4)-alpha-D-glucan 1-alpha-D-glucosylmutase
LSDYTVKALREAKLRSSWARPNDALEAACTAFAADLVDTARPNLFLDDFVSFQESVAFFGMLNGLAQVALKLTCPGVPDIYQGCELWDLNLVDPDNRRAVDFEQRAAMLASSGQDWGGLMAEWSSGAVKQVLLHRLLALRRALPDAFSFGDYVPLPVQGARVDHVVAFMRQRDGQRAAVIVGRLFARLWEDGQRIYDSRHWRDTWVELPGLPVEGREQLSMRLVRSDGDRFAVEDLLKALPVAVVTETAISAG